VSDQGQILRSQAFQLRCLEIHLLLADIFQVGQLRLHRGQVLSQSRQLVPQLLVRRCQLVNLFLPLLGLGFIFV
jgi:hypothetical protein